MSYLSCPPSRSFPGPTELNWMPSCHPGPYCAVKKVFVKTFAKFFEVFASFFEVFARFSRFSDLFGPIRIHSDLLGRIRMHSDAFGSVRTFSKKFGFFEPVFNGFGRNLIKNFCPGTISRWAAYPTITQLSGSTISFVSGTVCVNCHGNCYVWVLPALNWTTGPCPLHVLYLIV